MNGRVYRNIGWNGLFLIGQTLLALVVVPLLLHSVGDTGFGVYSFFLALVAISQLFQAGLDLAMARAVARFRGDQDTGRLYDDLSFGYLFCLGAGLFQAALILVLTHLTPLVRGEDAALAGKLSIVFAVSAVCNGPLSVCLAVLSGLERFAVRNLITSMPLVTGLVAALYLSTTDLGAEGIVLYAAVGEGTKFLMGSANVVWVNRLLPHLARLSRAALFRRDILAFQVKQVGNQVADYLFYTSDRLILTSVAGVAVVAHYAVAERPNMLAQSIVSAPLIAIIPSLSTALATNDTGYIHKVVTSGSRVYCWLTMPALLAMLVSANDLIVQWVGNGYTDSARAAEVFIVCMVVAAPFKIYSHLRLAEGTIGVMTVSKLGYAPVNAIGSYFLAQQWGLMGVVVPTAVFWALIYPAVWMVSMAGRKELALFVRVCHRPVLATIVCLAVMTGIHQVLSGPSFIQAFGIAAINGVLGLIVFATVGGGLQARRTRADVVEPEAKASAIDLAAKDEADQIRAMS